MQNQRGQDLLFGQEIIFAVLRRQRLGQSDRVVRAHKMLNLAAVILLGYAIAAIYAHWSLATAAVLLVNGINTLHYASYRGSPRVN